MKRSTPSLVLLLISSLLFYLATNISDHSTPLTLVFIVVTALCVVATFVSFVLSLIDPRRKALSSKTTNSDKTNQSTYSGKDDLLEK